MKRARLTRREALAGYASLLAAAGVSRAQQPQLLGEPAGRIAPVAELVNAFEFEAMAQRKLDAAAFSEIAGSDRRAFERMTFRPRLMVNTTGLDLTAELFGKKMFAPILVGPSARQSRFHAEGEVAMVRGAASAKTVVVVSARSSVPFEKIAAQENAGLWYQVEAEADMAAVRGRAQAAVKAGCHAVVLTLDGTHAALDWPAVDRLRQGLDVPFVLKGIMSVDEAQAAVTHGVQGIVVSNYRSRPLPGIAASIEVLPEIARAVDGKAAVLIDGSFRRGSDILKALALGAKAVLLGRPPLWGLSAYGAQGVQQVLELLQLELARDMAMCGRATLKDLDSTLVRIHRW
jgi:4-hydroxymandelate oxidase